MRFQRLAKSRNRLDARDFSQVSTIPAHARSAAEYRARNLCCIAIHSAYAILTCRTGCWCFIAAHEQALSNMRVPQRKRLGPLRCPRNPTTHIILVSTFMEHSASPFSPPPFHQQRGVAVESLRSDPRTGPMGPTRL
jgi:hypothetical protein